ncbi:MAG: universal stress protein [Candidatus Tectomicrobia bacterium]|nr:universal stress protein [Candidatus Tectomicrobia bacterium]
MITQHILVPIDFSAYANQALENAIELAKALRARLTLLHVVDTMSWGVAQAQAAIPPSVWQDLETSLAERMETSRKRVQAAGLQVETLILHGAPSQTIIDTAQDKGADLIVMGTHGRTRLTHALVGSVAEKVVRLAPCPVWVARGTPETSSA